MKKFSPTVEDYLGVIYVLERDGTPVQGVRLAELLEVSAPTVTNTLKRMVRDGLLEMDAQSRPHLTEAGWEAGKGVLRRHMLAEWMLSQMLSWDKLHDEAHAMEHGISAEVEAAMFQNLNQPELCPHGNPLPGNENIVQSWIALTDLAPGDQVVIRRIHELLEETPGVLVFLESKGIQPGVKARVVENVEFNQAVTLALDESLVTLGYSLAEFIFVQPAAA